MYLCLFFFISFFQWVGYSLQIPGDQVRTGAIKLWLGHWCRLVCLRFLPADMAGLVPFWFWLLYNSHLNSRVSAVSTVSRVSNVQSGLSIKRHRHRQLDELLPLRKVVTKVRRPEAGDLESGLPETLNYNMVSVLLALAYTKGHKLVT